MLFFENFLFKKIIYVPKVKLATVVKGDLKAPFSIATTLRCRGGCNSFPRIAPLYLDTYLIFLSVLQGGIKYHFLRLGLNPGLVLR